MATDLPDLNPHHKWPAHWGVLSLMSLVMTIVAFYQTKELGKEHLRFVEITYAGYEMRFLDERPVDKIRNFITRSRAENQALIVYSPAGQEIWFTREWRAEFNLLKNEALKGEKLKIYFDFRSDKTKRPRRLEVNGKLIADKTPSVWEPWLCAALTAFFAVQFGRRLKKRYQV